jgi:hypothetical protein
VDLPPAERRLPIDAKAMPVDEPACDLAHKLLDVSGILLAFLGDKE